MHSCLEEIYKGIFSVESLFSVEEIQWWIQFFEQQREFNESLLLEERPLMYPSQWPRAQGEIFTLSEIPMGIVNEEEIEKESTDRLEIFMLVLTEIKNGLMLKERTWKEIFLILK